jgi:hypothetical protein
MVIYGIRQIEKQFPGFEARWVGGMVFDMRELFNPLWNRTEHDYKGPGASTFLCTAIEKDAIFRFPANPIYFILGRKRDGTFEECAARFDYESTKEFKPVFNDYDQQISTGFIAEFIGYKHNPKKNNNNCDVRRAKSCFMALEYSRGEKYGHILTWLQSSTDRGTIDYEYFGSLVHDVFLSLFFLNVRNIKQKTGYISQARGFHYPKAWGREYKVLSLSQTLTERSPGPDLPPGYHVRGHFQRGHFKRKPNGVYWWNPHWRGDFSKGIVMKDYKA